MKILFAAVIIALATTVASCSQGTPPPPTSSTSSVLPDPASCPAFPAFPDAACTGPTGTLAPYTGPMAIYGTNNVTIQDVEIPITGTTNLYIASNNTNLTFRNVKFVYTGALNENWTMVNLQANGVTFQNCEFDGRGSIYDTINGIGTGLTVRNSNMHHAGRAISADGPMLVQDNYIHDIFTPAGQNWHADGIFSNVSGTGVPSVHDIQLIHNTIILTGSNGLTGPVNIRGTTSAPAYNILVQYNLIAGGSYAMYTTDGDNATFRVLDNHFSTQIHPQVGLYGIWYGPSGVVRQGNVIHETGAPADS